MSATKSRALTQVEQMYLNNIDQRSDHMPALDAHAWPGGYPIYYVDRCGDVLCPTCAQAILEAHRADDLLVALGSELGWDEFDEDGICYGPDPVLNAMRDAIGAESTREVPIAYDVHYEGPPLDCEECGAQIESAYGDPDEDSDGDSEDTDVVDPDPVMMTGYAYELGDKSADWELSLHVPWDIVVYSPDGNERHVGEKFIYSSRCNVWHCADGLYRAQVRLA